MVASRTVQSISISYHIEISPQVTEIVATNSHNDRFQPIKSSSLHSNADHEDGGKILNAKENQNNGTNDPLILQTRSKDNIYENDDENDDEYFEQIEEEEEEGKGKAEDKEKVEEKEKEKREEERDDKTDSLEMKQNKEQDSEKVDQTNGEEQESDEDELFEEQPNNQTSKTKTDEDPGKKSDNNEKENGPLPKKTSKVPTTETEKKTEKQPEEDSKATKPKTKEEEGRLKPVSKESKPKEARPSVTPDEKGKKLDKSKNLQKSAAKEPQKNTKKLKSKKSEEEDDDQSSSVSKPANKEKKGKVKRPSRIARQPEEEDSQLDAEAENAIQKKIYYLKRLGLENEENYDTNLWTLIRTRIWNVSNGILNYIKKLPCGSLIANTLSNILTFIRNLGWFEVEIPSVACKIPQPILYSSPRRRYK